jgi:heme/copper-type cytochrome/quinol oxidase subunit 1
MKHVLTICLIALVVFTAHAWTPLLLDSPAVMAFVTSKAFWPAMFGAVLVIGLLFAAAAAAILFHPGSLSGRTEPEGGL